jgi:hypothetical protein
MFVSDNAETGFGCFESKLASKDTLLVTCAYCKCNKANKLKILKLGGITASTAAYFHLIFLKLFFRPLHIYKQKSRLHVTITNGSEHDCNTLL